MFADKISNAKDYYNLGERYKKAFDYLQNTDLKSLEVGTYQIDGDEVYVMIQEYVTKPADMVKWESHKLYADIQYVIAGEELMGYAPVTSLTDVVDLTPSKDKIEYKDGKKKGGYLLIEAGMFAIFLPQDGHQPCVTNLNGTKVKKAVVKVLV